MFPSCSLKWCYQIFPPIIWTNIHQLHYFTCSSSVSPKYWQNEAFATFSSDSVPQNSTRTAMLLSTNSAQQQVGSTSHFSHVSILVLSSRECVEFDLLENRFSACALKVVPTHHFPNSIPQVNTCLRNIADYTDKVAYVEPIASWSIAHSHHTLCNRRRLSCRVLKLAAKTTKLQFANLRIKSKRYVYDSAEYREQKRFGDIHLPTDLDLRMMKTWLKAMMYRRMLEVENFKLRRCVTIQYSTRTYL